MKTLEELVKENVSMAEIQKKYAQYISMGTLSTEALIFLAAREFYQHGFLRGRDSCVSELANKASNIIDDETLLSLMKIGD